MWVLIRWSALYVGPDRGVHSMCVQIRWSTLYVGPDQVEYTLCGS